MQIYVLPEKVVSTYTWFATENGRGLHAARKLSAYATKWLPTIKHNKCLQVAWDRKWLIHFANLTCHLESPVRPIEKQRYAKNLNAT